MTNMFEGDDETPWFTPGELDRLGMILYPTSLLFRVVRALERALEDLRAGEPTPKKDGVSLREFEDIVGLPQWAQIEEQF